MNSEKIKLLLGGAAGGAIVLAIIGFAWGGWVTGGTAREMAVVAAGDAVVERLAPICVAQYTQDPEKDQKLKTMMVKNAWERHKYVAQQGWAMMPGEKNSDVDTSRKCAELIAALGQ
ncbi:MAG: hypothetical protein VCA18_04035 [Opitutales bacterium]